jgi:hypothetical protein
MSRGYLPSHDVFGPDAEDHNRQQDDLKDQHEILSRRRGEDPYPMHPVQQRWDEEDALLDQEPMVNKQSEKECARAVQEAKGCSYMRALGTVRMIANTPEVQQEAESVKDKESFRQVVIRMAIKRLS